MTYRVIITANAREDLGRLFDYLLERELARDGDLDYADEAVNAILASLTLLDKFPFTCRKAEESSFLRELIIPFGRTGYVALFEIASDHEVVVTSIRHQREDDYH